MVKKTWRLIFLFLMFTAIGWAQDHRFDVALSVGPVINKESSGNGTTQTPTNSGVAVAMGKMRLTDRVSIAAVYGRTKESQIYFASPDTFRIQGPVSEFGGELTYSFIRRKKLEAFALGGVSALVFVPNITVIDGGPGSLPVGQQTKPAPVYGVGVDYHLRWRFAVRIMYRGLFYKAPDFKVSNLFTGDYGHMAEPTVGLVFRFR